MSIFEIHPLIIHFPIALFTTAVLFDSLALFTKNTEFEIVGKWAMFTALLSALAAIITGFMADTIVGHFGSVFPVWKNHGWGQISTSILFLIISIWRLKMGGLPRDSKMKWTYFLISGAVLMLLFYGSHMGAKLANRI